MAYINNRVGKLDQTQGSRRRKGRGRPPTWTASHQKKLLVLGLCGMQTKVIRQVFNYLYGDDFATSDRTLQDILAKLLSPGWRSRDTPRHKSQARTRTAHLRTLIGSSRRRRHTPSNQPTSRGNICTHTNQIENNEELMNLAPLSTSESILDSVTRTQGDDQQGGFDFDFDFIQETNVQKPFPNFTSDMLNVEISVYSQRPSPRTNRTPGETDSAVNANEDGLSIRSNRSALRQIFQRGSLSSSMFSDLASLLRSTYSRSTNSLTTSSNRSLSVMENVSDSHVSHSARTSFLQSNLKAMENEIIDPTVRVAKALQAHHRSCDQLTAYLEMTCCSTIDSKPAGCIHAGIASITRLRESYEEVYHSNYIIRPWVEGWQCNGGGQLHAAETLFYAAKLGAPAGLITALVTGSTSINNINEDGQTFLFFLNPKGFLSCTCKCFSLSSHSSSFECLVRLLERKSFNFDQMDHKGRHFLSYLSASYPGDINALFSWIDEDQQWLWRLTTLSGLRDASGCFLMDFMASIPGHHKLKDLAQPLFNGNLSAPQLLRTRSGEDTEGRTALVNTLERPSLIRAPLANLVSNLTSNPLDINHYDLTGRTPLMAYLEKAFESRSDESTIVANVKTLVYAGANVNSRSRNGRSVLHLVAKRAQPMLVEYLLSVGPQVNQLDNTGRSVLDYASQNVLQSISRNVQPEQTARSLKTAMALLDRGAKTFYSFRSSRKATEILSNDEPSTQCVKTLVKHGAKRTYSISSGPDRYFGPEIPST